VLATPVGSIPEIMERFEPAWLARSASPGDIAALLRRYLHGELPQHPPAALHAQVRRDYSRERLLASYLDAMLGERASNLAAVGER
jgi:hypothetical protein